MIIKSFKRVFFVDPLFSALSSPVLHSQVFMHMKMLSEIGLECHFFGADRPESINSEHIDEICDRYGMSSLTVVPVPDLGLSYKQFSLAINRTIPLLMNYIDNYRPDYTFTWNIPVWKALNRIAPKLRGPLIFQCQGALSCEVRANGSWASYLKALYWQHQEKRCFQNAEVLVSVSHQMSHWMKNLSGRQADFVIPCCYDTLHFRHKPEQRFIKREKLGWPEDAPVIVYAGGTSHWQRIKEMMDLLVRVQGAVDDLHVLFLSGDVELFNNLIAATGLNSAQAKVFSVPHYSVGDWLNSADVGLILRHNTTLNNVASPIKLAEYMACGLAVIATNGIGDYSSIIEDEKVGILLDEDLSDHAIKKIAEFLLNRNKINRYSRNALREAKQFSWNEVKNVLKNIYMIQ